MRNHWLDRRYVFQIKRIDVPSIKEVDGKWYVARYRRREFNDWQAGLLEQPNPDYLHVDGTWDIIEEAAFIKKMEDRWKAMYPCLSCGGKAIALSTPNGPKGWFYETYNAAKRGFNDWKIFENSYREHPDYQSKEWEVDLKAQLGEEGWKQEVLAEF